jgi:hypothetical protein
MSPQGKMVLSGSNLLDLTLFEQQASFFVITMKNNNHDALHLSLDSNLTTKFCGCLALRLVIMVQVDCCSTFEPCGDGHCHGFK